MRVWESERVRVGCRMEEQTGGVSPLSREMNPAADAAAAAGGGAALTRTRTLLRFHVDAAGGSGGVTDLIPDQLRDGETQQRRRPPLCRGTGPCVLIVWIKRSAASFIWRFFTTRSFEVRDFVNNKVRHQMPSLLLINAPVTSPRRPAHPALPACSLVLSHVHPQIQLLIGPLFPPLRLPRALERRPGPIGSGRVSGRREEECMEAAERGTGGGTEPSF